MPRYGFISARDSGRSRPSANIWRVRTRASAWRKISDEANRMDRRRSVRDRNARRRVRDHLLGNARRRPGPHLSKHRRGPPRRSRISRRTANGSAGSRASLLHFSGDRRHVLAREPAVASADAAADRLWRAVRDRRLSRHELRRHSAVRHFASAFSPVVGGLQSDRACVSNRRAGGILRAYGFGGEGEMKKNFSVISATQWTLLTTLGLAGGMLTALVVGKPIGKIVGAMLVTAILTSLVGAVLGGLQAVWLRRMLARPIWWIAATTGGVGIGLAAGIVLVEQLGTLLSGQRPN